MEANERMKNKVVELECKINQGPRKRQEIIKNLERQFEYLEKIQPTKSLPHTTKTKLRHEFFYKPPSIQNDNDKGDVKFIEEDETKPILTMLNPNLINYNSLTVSPFLKYFTVHIPYTNAKTFIDDLVPNHVGEKKLNSIDGVRTRRMTKKKKSDMGKPKEPKKEWKLIEKAVPHKKSLSLSLAPD
nr:hypothetical protein [Tanacetum cinerariifolium]